MTRTHEEHVRIVFDNMKGNSKNRGHDKLECKSYHELLALCVDRCVGKKLVDVTLNDETTTFKVGFKKTDDGFFLPVAFTNGLFFSLSIERINEDIGYVNGNWKNVPCLLQWRRAILVGLCTAGERFRNEDASRHRR
jgi:hypothetical protein